MTDFYLTPIARRAMDSLSNVSTASQFAPISADNIYVRATRPYYFHISGIAGNTTSLVKVDIYRPLSTDTDQPYPGMVQTSGYITGVTTQTVKTLVSSTLPNSTGCIVSFGPISGKFAYFPATSDKVAGNLYHKLVLYGSDIHVHAVFTTDPVVHAEYIG